MRPRRINGRNPKGGFFRGSFTLNETPSEAWTKITADSGFVLFINEYYVGESFGFAKIESHEVARFLRPGRNVVAVHLLTMGGRKGVAFQLSDKPDADPSRKLLFVSEPKNWKYSPVEIAGWRTPSFDDSAWTSPAIVSPHFPWPAPEDGNPAVPPELAVSPFFKDRPLPKRKDLDKAAKVAGSAFKRDYLSGFEAKSFPKDFFSYSRRLEDDCVSWRFKKLPKGFKIEKGASNVVIDFGKELAGFLTLKFKTPFTGNVYALYGENKIECAEEPGEFINYHVVRKDFVDGARVFRCRDRQGFRFVRLELSSVAGAPFEVEEIFVENSIYKTEKGGYFRCDDEELNKIWQVCRRTLHLCMQEHYLDGIKRDRLLWVADAFIEDRVNAYVFGDRDLFKYDWHFQACRQHACGAIPAEGVEGGILYNEFTAFWLWGLWESHVFFDDVEFLKLERETVLRAAAYLLSKRNKRGLLDQGESPNEIDGGVSLAGSTGEELPLNCLAFKALLATASICETLGDAKNAAFHREQAEALRAAIDKLLWDESKKAYFRRKNGETLYDFNTLAVAFGICDEKRAATILKRVKKELWTPVRSSDSTSIPLGVFEVETRFDKGQTDDALELIHRIHGSMLKKGATSFWEGYVDSMAPGVVSFCHGWAAWAAWALSSRVAGVKPLKPGFAEFEVAPQFGRLKSVAAVVPTKRGLIAVSFKKSAKGLSGSVHVPEGTTAVLRLPAKKLEVSGGAFERVSANSVRLLDGGEVYSVKASI